MFFYLLLLHYRAFVTMCRVHSLGVCLSAIEVVLKSYECSPPVEGGMLFEEKVFSTILIRHCCCEVTVIKSMIWLVLPLWLHFFEGYVTCKSMMGLANIWMFAGGRGSYLLKKTAWLCTIKLQTLHCILSVLFRFVSTLSSCGIYVSSFIILKNNENGAT